MNDICTLPINTKISRSAIPMCFSRPNSPYIPSHLGDWAWTSEAYEDKEGTARSAVG
jgi:hypothetical protein